MARAARPPARQLRAIVVGHVDLGERDRILRLLTAELGRISAIARGARGSRRRFAGAMDSGALVAASLRPGRGELWVLDEATLLEGRDRARQDLLRLSLLAYAVELCSSLARTEHPEPRLFGLLEIAALLIDAMTGAPGPAFRAGLEAKALTFAGLAPSLERCVVCGKGLGGATRFSSLR
ncbi:MAG: DNA repair protein RecO, partial [Deltaproteobacteria bacterium]